MFYPLTGSPQLCHAMGFSTISKPTLDPQFLPRLVVWIAKAEFLKMEAAGIIRYSDSPWASPIHMVPKKDGSWRPCGDYRRFNDQTIPDLYSLLPQFSQSLTSRRAINSRVSTKQSFHLSFPGIVSRNLTK